MGKENNKADVDTCLKLKTQTHMHIHVTVSIFFLLVSLIPRADLLYSVLLRFSFINLLLTASRSSFFLSKVSSRLPTTGL